VRYLNLSKNNSQQIFTYKIADSDYQSNQRIDLFKCWIKNNSTNTTNTPIVAQYSASSNLYQDHTYIGEKSYDLSVDAIEPTGYLLKTKNQSFQLDQNCIHCNLDCIDTALLFGPVLILNLAMNGVFCLHASAFKIKGKVFILMGDSGTGKSTVARFMSEQANSTRLADDILPLKISNDEITVLPNFPQLKLPVDKQYKGKKIVGEIVLLFAQKSNNETALSPVDTFYAIKNMIKHSVATKLFANNELQNHLSFCHQVSSRVKNYRLYYQHSANSLEQLYNVLNELN